MLQTISPTKNGLSDKGKITLTYENTLDNFNIKYKLFNITQKIKEEHQCYYSKGKV